MGVQGQNTPHYASALPCPRQELNSDLQSPRFGSPQMCEWGRGALAPVSEPIPGVRVTQVFTLFCVPCVL